MSNIVHSVNPKNQIREVHSKRFRVVPERQNEQCEFKSIQIESNIKYECFVILDETITKVIFREIACVISTAAMLDVRKENDKNISELTIREMRYLRLPCCILIDPCFIHLNQFWTMKSRANNIHSIANVYPIRMRQVYANP